MTEIINSKLPVNSLEKFGYLRIYLDFGDHLKLHELYEDHIRSHNDDLGLLYDCEQKKYIMTNSHPNSGFDLLVPQDITVPEIDSANGKVTMVKFSVKAEMFTISNENESAPSKTSTGYYLMPRSSISKTPLMQANHVGLIDMGYRGEIMAAVRNVSNEPYKIQTYTRLFQLCHPETIPIWVEIVKNESELSTTRRGDGGFGSTGLIGAI